MIEYKLILPIMAIHMAAVISPGPDFIMVVKNALTYSRKTGVYTAIGIGFGIVIHVLYTFFGIGLLIKETPSLFNFIKYIGAVYIIYVGAMSLFAQPSPQKVIVAGQESDISPFKAFRIGFITNALNVKASMFFLGLFTTMISSDTSLQTLYLLGFIVVFQTMLWFVLVAYFFTQPLVQKKFYQYENAFNKILGILLILLALKILFF